MEINDNTIIFESDDETYFKEKAGIKPNIVRFAYLPKEIEGLAGFYNEIKDEVKYIEIHNRISPHLFFKREIRDITWFGDRLVWIISWFHEVDGVQTGYNAPICYGKQHKRRDGA